MLFSSRKTISHFKYYFSKVLKMNFMICAGIIEDICSPPARIRKFPLDSHTAKQHHSKHRCQCYNFKLMEVHIHFLRY